MSHGLLCGLSARPCQGILLNRSNCTEEGEAATCWYPGESRRDFTLDGSAPRNAAKVPATGEGAEPRGTERSPAALIRARRQLAAAPASGAGDPELSCLISPSWSQRAGTSTCPRAGDEQGTWAAEVTAGVDFLTASREQGRGTSQHGVCGGDVGWLQGQHCGDTGSWGDLGC